MKIAIVSNCDILLKGNLGIFKKMYGQANAFLEHDMQVDFFYNKSYRLFQENLNTKTIKKYTPRNSEHRYSKILDCIAMEQYDIVYIRYGFSDYYFLSFLYNIKLINNNIKTVIDFPTYPYDAEIKYDKGFFNIDKYFRKKIFQYVDFGVCYNGVDKIFNIPVYNIGNGIDLNNIHIKQDVKLHNKKEINLIGVANIAFWHGYDRVISGLRDYYDDGIKEYDINFYIVGVGSELGNLINMTKENGLNEHVKFLGAKNGKELDEVFNLCQIAVGTLGMYRKDLCDGADLKSREYCSRGIPFIYGYYDKDFSEDFKYALKVSNDNSNINIDDVINFYENISINEDVINCMRRYAEENLTWNKKVEVILNAK